MFKKLFDRIIGAIGLGVFIPLLISSLLISIPFIVMIIWLGLYVLEGVFGFLGGLSMILSGLIRQIKMWYMDNIGGPIIRLIDLDWLLPWYFILFGIVILFGIYAGFEEHKIRKSKKLNKSSADSNS